MADFFYQAFIYLAAAVISVPIARKLGLGSVLGYLIAGTVIGPYGLKFIGQEGQDIMHLAEFGVVIMLFLIGLELEPARLWRMRNAVLGMGGLQTLGTAAVLALISIPALDLQWQSALAVGLTLSLSSTAIALQTLNEQGLQKTEIGERSFSVLLFQDIAVIPMLAIFPLLAIYSTHSTGGGGHDASWIHDFPVWGKTLAVFGSVVLVIVIGRYVVRPVLRIIAGARMRELFIAAALFLIISIAILMTKVGLSPALGTFLAGVMLAGSEYRHELESEIEPFKGLLLGLFFIAVGASIDLNLIANEPLKIALIVFGLISIKLGVLAILGAVFRMRINGILTFSFALAQGGEFAFVLFSFAEQNGVIRAETAAPLMGAVALSMALTPILMLVNEKLLQPRMMRSGTKEPAKHDDIDEENKVIIAGFGSFGNVVGRLLRAQGVRPTVLDLDPERVEVLRKLGMKVFYGDASRLDLLQAARADEAKIMILATGDPEKNLEIASIVQKHFPRMKLLCRSANRTESYRLIELGIGNPYRESFDTALRMGVDTLKLLGYRAHQAYRASRNFRRQDEMDLKELAGLSHNRTAYLSLARQRIKDLEDTLIAEVGRKSDSKDLGWDTISLRNDIRRMTRSKENQSNYE